MYYRIALLPIFYLVGKTFIQNGGLNELTSFQLVKSTPLVNGMITNIIIASIFAEIYWAIDSSDGHKHFNFESSLDAYYESLMISSSVGFGDITPKTKTAKILVMVQIVTMFFTVIPAVVEALKPGN